MSGPVAVDQVDEIRVFLPSISDEEHAVRAKLRSLRNTAAAMIGKTESSTARQLAWIVTGQLTPFMYAPASMNELEELRRFATRLMLTAIQAETLHDEGIGE